VKDHFKLHFPAHSNTTQLIDGTIAGYTASNMACLWELTALIVAGYTLLSTPLGGTLLFASSSILYGPLDSTI
jgi:hypothetical protein